MSEGIYHGLGLHMHQPPDNLQLLIETNDWEAKQIILCYQRPLKYARAFPDVARINVGFSGILLEQLQDEEIQKRYASIIDIPQMLEGYAEEENIELIGMGYYHPIFPLIPKEDWEAQLKRGREKMRKIFGREPQGFWPPEMAFSMEMIPALKRAGYQYAVIDGIHVKPENSLKPEEVLYRPHVAEYDGYEIIIIPRDRDLSNAQESGLNPEWFANEVRSKTAECKEASLVTTWSDGENGGWFRQTDEPSGFWGFYFSPYMERVRARNMPLSPIKISDFLQKNPPLNKVRVETGAWNIENRGGNDFSQWDGSDSQKKALQEVWDISRCYHELDSCLKQEKKKGRDLPGIETVLNSAYEYLLKSQTSCYLFWGDAWIPKLYEVAKKSRELLEEARRKLLPLANVPG